MSRIHKGPEPLPLPEVGHAAAGRVVTPVVGLLAVPGRVVTPVVGLLVLPGRVVAPEDGALYSQVTEPVRSFEPVQV